MEEKKNETAVEAAVVETSLIEADERIDEIGFGGLKLIQKPKDFCYGVDAVLIAEMASHSLYKGRAIDLGTGTGIIPLILSALTDIAEIKGVEIQKGSFERAERNIELNRGVHEVEKRLSFVNEDIADYRLWGEEFRGSFDIVTSNPPYTKSSGGMKSENSAKMIARHETTAGLETFMRAADYLLKPKGDFYMVHRPSRLVDIISLGRKLKLEPKELEFVCPKKGEAPNIVLVHMVKGAGAELKVLGELAVHDEDGGYTPELLKRYRK